MSSDEVYRDGSVKVIDFSPAQFVPTDKQAKWDPTDDQKQLAKTLVHEFKTVGFVCLTNTPIDQQKVI